MRFATVKNAESRSQLEAYLPSNYKILSSQETRDNVVFVIGGEDNAGWTMDDYVIPRLGSGLIFAEEIEDYVEVEETRYVIFEGKLVIVEALSQSKVQVRTMNDGGLYPKVNGIPVDFSIFVKDMGDRGHRVTWSSIYRKDESWPKDEPTPSQVSKLYAFALKQAEALSDRAREAGQYSHLGAEIRNVDRQIETLKKEIESLEEARKEFEQNRDELLVG